MTTEYISISLGELEQPNTIDINIENDQPTDHHQSEQLLMERSPGGTTITGISFRRRDGEYSPVTSSVQDHHSTLRTDSSLDSSYLDESTVSTPHRLIPTPHSIHSVNSVSFRASLSRESRDGELTNSPIDRPIPRPKPREGWHASNCESIQSIQSFSEDEHDHSSGVDDGGPIHNYQSEDSFNSKESHVKMTLKAECVTNKSKTLSVNDYTFLKTIGKGAFADVKLATKTQTDPNAPLPEEKFAIKMIKKNCFRDRTRSMKFKSRGNITSPAPPGITSSPGSSSLMGDVVVVPEEVIQEINIMKFLQHPHLVTLHEIIDDVNSHYLYLIMEYMECGPIMTFNQVTQSFVSPLTNSVLLESTARRAFSDLMSALAYLHKNFIAHRDLKPDNLLVDFHGNLKVTDFGVSSHFTDEKRKTAVNLKQLARSKSRGIVSKTEGTFPFYSPEMCQESGAAYSAYMSDLWAAGVCLWIFIFGKLPFYDSDVVTLFAMIRNDDPVRPHRLSPELDNLLTLLMRKNPTKRLSVSHIQSHCWITGKFLKPSRRLTPPKLSNDDSNVAVAVTSGISYETLPSYLTDVTEDQLSNRIRFKIFRWKESAKATCAARKEKIMRMSNLDFSALYRKSQLALKAQNSDSSAETEEFNFDDHDSASSHDSDPLARVVSYDIIGQEMLEDIAKAEKKGRKSILAFLEQDDEKIASRRTPPPIPPASTSTPQSTNSTSPGSAILPPELVKKEKKGLRTGRKKVNITTTGDIVPIEHSDSSSLMNSPEKPHNSTVETLYKVMLELEKKEAEANLKQTTEETSTAGKKQSTSNRYFCCFTKS